MLLDLDHLIETLIFDKNYTWYWLLFPAFLKSQHNTFYLYFEKNKNHINRTPFSYDDLLCSLLFEIFFE